MAEPDNDLEQGLENWRQSRATLEEIVSLARDLGNRHYAPGIPALVELLAHEDEIVRYNAAMSLAFEFHYVPAVDKLLTMLVEDPDEDVRGVAAAALGNLCQNTKDPRALEALAKSSLSDSDEDVCASAYKALIIVNGVSREKHLKLLTGGNLTVDPDRVKAILAEKDSV